MGAEEIRKMAELKSRFNQTKAAYNKKKLEHRTAELSNIMSSFEEYYSNQDGFTAKMENGKVTVRVADSILIMEPDEFANNKIPSFDVQLRVQLPDNKKVIVGTRTSHDRNDDENKPGQQLTEAQILERDIAFYQDYIDDRFNVLTSYYVKKTDQEIERFDELEDMIKAI